MCFTPPPPTYTHTHTYVRTRHELFPVPPKYLGCSLAIDTIITVLFWNCRHDEIPPRTYAVLSAAPCALTHRRNPGKTTLSLRPGSAKIVGAENIRFTPLMSRATAASKR